MKRVISAVVVLIGLAAPARAGFDEGVAAYERGDYETALREFRPLAEQGLASAQYSLGLMYDNGEGVPQDYIQAHMKELEPRRGEPDQEDQGADDAFHDDPPHRPNIMMRWLIQAGNRSLWTLTMLIRLPLHQPPR